MSAPDYDFGTRLRDIRRSRDYSQARLAREVSELLGRTIYSQTVTKMERGQRAVSDPMEMAAICAVLNVEYDDLLPSISDMQARADEAALEAARSELAAVAARVANLEGRASRSA